MSSILAVISESASDNSMSVMRMQKAMSHRGSEWSQQSIADIATLAVAGYGWELPPSEQPDDRIYRDARITCVADATLYYKSDLARKIGVGNREVTPAAYIACAYLAHEEDWVTLLEGDYAFILWDNSRRRLFAARDFVGSRSLHFHFVKNRLVLASTIHGVLAADSVPKRVEMQTVVEGAACLSRHSNHTSFEGVLELPAGHMLTWHSEEGTRLRRTWQMPTFPANDARTFSESAEQLRSLLTDAVRERLTDRTAINLSGGYDSTAVYGIARSILRDATDANAASLVPVSMSYPPGDAGREDKLIEEVTRFCGDAPNFESVSSVQLFGEDPLSAVTTRDDVTGHHFESWNKKLFRRAQSLNCHYTLTGAGGDQLFHASGIYLAEVLSAGHPIRAWQQYRKRDGKGLRGFANLAVVPLLPPFFVASFSSLTGKSYRSFLDREPPAYFRSDYVLKHGLHLRDQSTRPAIPATGMLAREVFAGLCFAHVSRTMGRLFDNGLSCGIEVRHPLLDERVVRYALGRSWEEKVDGRDSKILLRAAVKGLLPESVLASRSTRTGQSGSYFLQQMRSVGYPLARSVAPQSPLTEMGIIDQHRYTKGWEHLLSNDDNELAFQLYHTLQAELWLRQNL